MTRGGEMQRVDLVDGDEAEASAVPRGPRPRRRVVIWAAAVVVVALGLLGAQRVVDARREAAVARLASVPGVLAPVRAAPLQVVERVTGESLRTRFGPAGWVEFAADGSQRYVWFDQGGTAARWTAPLQGPNPALAGAQGVFGGTQCSTDADRSDALASDMSSVRRVVCLVTDGGQPYSDEPLERVGAGAARVLVLDTADGAVRAEWVADDDDESLALLPGLAVVARAEGDDTVVTGRDVQSGTVRWTHRVEGGPAGDDEDPSWRRPNLYPAGGMLLVESLDGQVSVLSPGGRPVLHVDRDPTGRRGAQWSELRSGQLVLTAPGSDGSAATTIVAPDGDPDENVAVDGATVVVAVDDGSMPNLALTQTAVLQAWDATTGDPRWTSENMTIVGQVLIVLGRIYLATSVGVVALDAKTGKELWSVPWERDYVIGSVFTDGAHILVGNDALPETSEEGFFVAYDRDSGDEVFRTGYPQGVGQLTQLGDELQGIVSDSGDYALIGQPDD